MKSPQLAASTTPVSPQEPSQPIPDEQVITNGIQGQDDPVFACTFNGDCENLTEKECLARNGTWHPNILCDDIPPLPNQTPIGLVSQVINAVLTSAAAVAMKIAGIKSGGKKCR